MLFKVQNSLDFYNRFIGTGDIIGRRPNNKLEKLLKINIKYFGPLAQMTVQDLIEQNTFLAITGIIYSVNILRSNFSQ